MSTVEYSVTGSIAELRLNRPDKLNAINSEMRLALDAALSSAEQDDAVRVIIISGIGKAFSAGFDLDMGKPENSQDREQFLRQELRNDYDLIMRFWDCPKPTIASVHGYCLGSSMEIAAVCDLTIAADDSRFGAPEVCYGSGIVCLVMPWIVGLKNAKEILLTGTNNVGSDRALQIGLVNRVVAAANLRTETAALAATIAANDAFAVQQTKLAINKSFEIAGMREALEQALETDIRIESTETPESTEFNCILAKDGPKAALAWRAKRIAETLDQ
jgi:enoyl-CoA hydratase